MKIFANWSPEDRRFIDGAPLGSENEIVLSRDPHGWARSVEGVPRKWVYHSPDGFEWGYGGSGPADLALNILRMFVPPPEAWRLHHEFKFGVIAIMDREKPVIVLPLRFVEGWIQGRWSRDPETVESDG